MLFENGATSVAIVGDCLVVLLSGTMSTLVVNAVERGLSELSRRPNRISYLSLIDPAMRGIDADARERMAAVVRRHSKQIAGAAMVSEGSGFRATAVRSIITAIHLASRAAHPLRVFESLEPALVWLKTRPGNVGLDTRALTDFVRSARRGDCH
jgi:MFS superfamily sulfate permease-like transporter